MTRNNNEYLIYLPWHLKEINNQQNKMKHVSIKLVNFSQTYLFFFVSLLQYITCNILK